MRIFSYCQSVWEDRRWIKRKVDTISFHNAQVVVRNSSFDIDYSLLHDRFQLVQGNKNRRIPVPLILHKTEPVLDMSISLNGIPQSVATQEQSVKFAQAITFGHFFSTPRSKQFSERRCFEVMSQVTYLAFKDDCVRYLEYLIVAILSKFHLLDDIEDTFIIRLMQEYGYAVIEREINLHRISDPLTALYLVDFTSELLETIDEVWGGTNIFDGHHILLTYLDHLGPGENAVLKMQTRHAGKKPGLTSWATKSESIMNLTSDFTFSASTLPPQRENRYHLHISAPPEFIIYRVSRELLDVEEVGKSSNNDRTYVDLYTHSANKTTESNRTFPNLRDSDTRINYTASQNILDLHSLDGEYNITETPPTVVLQLKFGVFHLKALISFILLGCFTFFSHYIRNYTSAEDSELSILSVSVAVAAVLFTFPTLFHNSNESILASELLFKYRVIFGISIGFNLFLSIIANISFGTFSSLLTRISIGTSGVFVMFLLISLLLHGRDVEHRTETLVSIQYSRASKQGRFE